MFDSTHTIVLAVGILARQHVRGIADPACTRYQRRIAMSKYLLGWLLGVPVVVLVIIYLIFN
ncbi:MAG: hypothetical protein M3461_19250 [Pseudomonadota bacterium]|nr:hypothetical protein [Pseudomonadota bacterium]